MKAFFLRFPERFRELMKVKKWNFLIKFCSAFLITTLVLGGGALGVYQYLFGKMDQDKALKHDEIGITENTKPVSEDLINIALFGVDSTNAEMTDGRSDSIVIVTIDTKQKEIRMSAVQRDSYVNIEGYGKDKINHAYAYGGPKLAVKTLNQNFGLNITDYVVINFANMEKVINILGGIQLDVSDAYRYEANRVIGSMERTEFIPSTGLQTLNGIQVMGMVRARHNVGGTEARSNMHEVVLAACMEKVKTINVMQYPELIRNIMALVKTTLSIGDVSEVAMSVLTGNYTMRNAVFPLSVDQPNGDGGRMINGVWYLTFDEGTCMAHIQDFVFDGVLYGEETKE